MQAPGEHHRFRFALAPVYDATPAGLRAAYASAQRPYTQDGLLLLHREGSYVAGAPSPLALFWKDAACSRCVPRGPR